MHRDLGCCRVWMAAVPPDSATLPANKPSDVIHLYFILPYRSQEARLHANGERCTPAKICVVDALRRSERKQSTNVSMHQHTGMNSLSPCRWEKQCRCWCQGRKNKAPHGQLHCSPPYFHESRCKAPYRSR